MGPLLYDRTSADEYEVDPSLFKRQWLLDDIHISRAHTDGRTVEAYAAIFNTPYEVVDQHGHYMERIQPHAFENALRGQGRYAPCLYNHGMNLDGTPNPMGQIPLGSALEIRADERGLLTVTRYNKGPYAEQVLESIRNGDIRSQSFRGRIVRSTPMGKAPKRKPGYPLPTVVRHELGLSDFGPTPIPVNTAEMIVAVRSISQLARELQELDVDGRTELLRALGADLDGDPQDQGDLEQPDGADEAAASADTEDDTAVALAVRASADGPPLRHPGRLELRRKALAAARICADALRE